MKQETGNYRTIFLQILAANLPALSQVLGAQWNDYEQRLKLLLRAMQPSAADAPKIADHIIKLSLAATGEFSQRCLSLSRQLAGQGVSNETSILKLKSKSNESFSLAHPLAIPDPVDEPSTLADAARQFLAAIDRVDLSGASLEPPAANDPHTPPTADEPREINITGYSPDGQPATHFNPGRAYTLAFKVGQPSPHNLALGDKVVKDVPMGGLMTQWVVTSTAHEFIGGDSDIELQKHHQTSIAKFDLLIPQTGESSTRTLKIVPQGTVGTLLVDIFALSATGQREPYRELSVSLSDTLAVIRDEVIRNTRHLHLSPTHEWTTPAEHISIVIVNSLAIVSTARVGPQRYDFFERFHATDTSLANSIDNVRRSLDLLRESHCEYLDNLDADELVRRLASQSWAPHSHYATGWAPLPDDAHAYKEHFSHVQSSAALRSLAKDGYHLYNRVFPEQSKLRAVLDGLLPGSRIDIHWTEQSGAGFVSHVPWALMYTQPVEDSSAPDPELFVGLRFRVAPRAWTVQNASVTMGDLDTAHALKLLYWGDGPEDAVGQEARWQATQYSSWKWSTQVPSPGTADPKKQIVDALRQPAPAPVGILYMYCHCSVGDGSTPVLRFGNTLADTINRADMPLRRLADAPLIFANACSTSECDAHRTNELEQGFFERGARAFIGTEARVPVRLASKFAWLYFQFLYRRASADPIAAGEALTQARLFLWTQFRNIGGLFYSFTNQYDLYLACDEELHSRL